MSDAASAFRTNTPRKHAGLEEIPLPSISTQPISVAPTEGFQFQFCDCTEHSAGKKVLFYKPNQAFRALD